MSPVIHETIRQISGQWYVYSEDGQTRLAGPFATRDAAQARLDQIEFFKRQRS